MPMVSLILHMRESWSESLQRTDNVQLSVAQPTLIIMFKCCIMMPVSADKSIGEHNSVQFSSNTTSTLASCRDYFVFVILWKFVHKKTNTSFKLFSTTVYGTYACIWIYKVYRYIVWFFSSMVWSVTICDEGGHHTFFFQLFFKFEWPNSEKNIHTKSILIAAKNSNWSPKNIKLSPKYFLSV